MKWDACVQTGRFSIEHGMPVFVCLDQKDPTVLAVCVVLRRWCWKQLRLWTGIVLVRVTGYFHPARRWVGREA